MCYFFLRHGVLITITITTIQSALQTMSPKSQKMDNIYKQFYC